jgi:hypothetical protein
MIHHPRPMRPSAPSQEPNQNQPAK